MRGLWSRATIGWLWAAGLLPVAALVVVGGGGARLVLCLAVALAWQALFRAATAVPLSPSGVAVAVAVALLAPDGLAAWQLAFVTSFGLILADLAFGGWGRNVVSAPLPALVVLYLSFPAAPAPEPAAAQALASAAAALLFMVTGIVPLRLIAAFLAALGGGLALGGGDIGALLQAGAPAFCLVFLLADPATTPASSGGRIAYGALAGALTALFALQGAGIAAPQPALFAVFVAQVFAPLIDHAAIAISLRRSPRPDELS